MQYDHKNITDLGLRRIITWSGRNNSKHVLGLSQVNHVWTTQLVDSNRQLVPTTGAAWTQILEAPNGQILNGGMVAHYHFRAVSAGDIWFGNNPWTWLSGDTEATMELLGRAWIRWEKAQIDGSLVECVKATPPTSTAPPLTSTTPPAIS